MKNNPQDDLFKSDQLFRQLVENLGEGVGMVDENEVFIFSNQAGEALFGVAPGGLTGRSLTSFLAPEQVIFIQQQTKLRKTGEKSRYEIQIIRADGTPRVLDVTVTPWFNQQNHYFGAFAIFHDITDSRAEGEKLRQSEEQYRAIIEDQTEMICRYQSNGRITFVNEAFCRFWRLEREEIVGTHHMTYVPREERARIHAQVNSLSSACPAVSYEFRLQRWDGEYRWLQRTDRAIFDEKDRVLEYQSVCADISERRAAEDALKRQLALTELVTDISTRFINLSPQEIDSEIQQALKKIGEFTHTERAFLLLISPENQIAPESLEWIGESLSARSSLIQGCSPAVISWLMNTLHFKELSITSPEQLPQDGSIVKTLMGEIHIKALLALPLAIDGTAIGILGLATPSSDRDWSSEDLLLLRLIGELFINVLIRKKSTLELQTAQAQLNQRVKELEQRSREINLLSEMSNLLQIANSPDEAYTIIAQSISHLFQQASSALYIKNSVPGMMEIKGRSGNVTSESKMAGDDCWGLRRGRLYRASHSSLFCKHIPEQNNIVATICVPITIQSKTIGVLHLQSQVANALLEERQLLATAVAEQIGLALSNLQLRDDLRQQAIRDQLTGLYNRYYMEASLELELNRAQRSGSPISLIMLDIDHFKEYNDQFQHQAGDRLLRTLGRLLMRSARNGEIPCRYGGEEFLLILPGTSHAAALQRAQDIRLEVKATRSDAEGQPMPPVTISLGVASWPEHGHTVNDLLKASDAAMYQSKGNGRDQVSSAG